jgi:hypothetical protein
MDLVKLIGAVIAVAFFLAYVVITDVPANINTYVNQPEQIANQINFIIPKNISISSFNIDLQNLTRLANEYKQVSGKLSVEVPSFYHNLTGNLKINMPKIPERITGKLLVNLSSINVRGVYLNVYNDFNQSIVIENITGKYLFLPSEQYFAPFQEKEVFINVTNFTGFYELYSEGKENVTFRLNVHGINFSSNINLSKSSNVSLSVPNYQGGSVSVNITNTFPYSITIDNITGKYLYLEKNVTIGSNATSTAVFYVSNFTGFYDLYNQSKEIVNVSVEVDGIKISKEELLGKNFNVSLPNTLGGVVNVKVYNPFNFTIMLYKAYGKYFQLERAYALKPGYSYLPFNVTNFYLLYNNIKNKIENITVLVGIGNINITKTFPLGSSINLTYYESGEVSIAVSNPLNTTLIIYNITGKYLYLLNKTEIKPFSSGILRIYVTNFTGVPNEEIKLLANVYGENVSESFEISNSLSISINQVEVPVHNPFNETIIIYNVTGKYLYLTKSYTIPPGSTQLLEIKITNESEVFNENITIKAQIGQTNITYVTGL